MTGLTWVIAVLCAAAVGARLGRLTVRPPSLARSSVAIAAIAMTVAAAVRTPTVAVVISEPGSNTATLVFIGCWVVVTTATALIGAAAWPKVNRRALRISTIVIPVAAVVDLIALSLTGNMAVGSWFIIVTALFSLVVGLRYIAWNPLGRAITGFLAGLLVTVVVLLTDPAGTDPTKPWWAVAIIILSLACCSVMIESWFGAFFALRQTRKLWKSLLASHPELLDADYQSSTTVLRADDRVSQILDGMYLHAGAGLLSSEYGPAGYDTAEPNPSVRAREIAEWLQGPEGTPIDVNVLSTPTGFSDRRWVRMIAHDYDRADIKQ